MKRIGSLIIVCLCVLAAFGFDFEVNGLCYDVTAADEVAVVKGDQPYSGDCTIPAEVTWQDKTYRVTAVADMAFVDCELLRSIRMPEGLLSVGDAAFYGCAYLRSVHIPATLQTIGDEAFASCDRLTAFEVAEQNAVYSSQDGVLMNKSASCIIAYPNQYGDSYVVPSGVTEIGKWAFLHCRHLRAITFPQGLLAIGDAAFYGCSALEAVTLPNSVKTVGVWAFSECRLLSSVTIGESVDEIGEGAFSFCSKLASIRVAQGNNSYCSVEGVLLTKDQRRVVAYPGGRTGSYRIPATVDSIGNQAFFGCDSLQSVTLLAGLSAIGTNPFVFCDNLTEVLVSSDHPNFASRSGVLLNKDNTSILFYPNAKSGNYTVPNSVTAVQSGPFMRSRLLTGLTLPDGVERVGNWAFMDCEGLRTVSLPTTLQDIGERAFDTPALEEVIYGGTPMATTGFVPNGYQLTTLLMPKGSEDAFYQTTGWDVFDNYKSFGLCVLDQKIPFGTTAQIPVYTVGPVNMQQVQTDITLPSGMQLLKDDSGQYIIVLAEHVTGTLTCTQTGADTWHIQLQCSDERALGEDVRPLFFLTVKSSSGSAEGVYDLTMQQISFQYVTAVHQGSAFQPLQVAGIEMIANRSGIQSVSVTSKTHGPVYNLHGQVVRRAGESLNGLPFGIYIINGQKIFLGQ